MAWSKVVCMALAFAALGLGQAKQEAPPSRTRAAAQKKHAGGKNEDIQVHGHWLLEVRNQDGSLARRVEFENSLIAGSTLALAQTLNGGAFAGGWVIYLYQPSGGFPFTITQNAQACAALLPFSLACSPSLTIGLSPDLTQLILQGTSAPMASATTLGSFATGVVLCPPGTLPTACLSPANVSANLYPFSGAFTSTNVQQGQTVTVTVTYSFS